MIDFDMNKIKDMVYDPERGRYIGEDGSELRVTPYSDGRGYKFDYYESTTYDNEKHSSIHIKTDLNENWERVDNDRDTSTQEKSSGTGCYLTTACLKHLRENFTDDCEELTVLRWFRDTFVTEEDRQHYYIIAPYIVGGIECLENNFKIYEYIYRDIVCACVNAIKRGDYEFAYNRYKNSTLILEEKFAKPILEQKLSKTLNLIKK